MNNSVTIIAECGINHGGDLVNAHNMVMAAKEAGADAAKFQLFTDQARPKGKKFILDEAAWRVVMDTGREVGLPVFFSVFDFESVDLAKRLGARWVKLSFVERRNFPLIERCQEAGFGRKFVSVDLYDQYDGASFKEWGWEKLYCPNNGWSGFYPTKDNNIEWERYQGLAREMGMGWSDHCEGWTEAVVCAVSGAKVIEKHFKIDNDCPDAGCSTGPERFKLMVQMIRELTAPRTVIRIPEGQLSPEEKAEFEEIVKTQQSRRGHKLVVPDLSDGETLDFLQGHLKN